MIEWWQNGMLGCIMNTILRCIMEWKERMSHETECLQASSIPFHETSGHSTLWHFPTFYKIWAPNIAFHDVCKHLIPTFQSITCPNIPLHETSKSSIFWHFPTFSSMIPPSIPFNYTSENSVPWKWTKPHAMTHANIPFQHFSWLHVPTFHSMTLQSILFKYTSVPLLLQWHQPFSME